jgi:hypothetical protein
MNQMKPAYVIAVGLVVLLVLGCISCNQHGKPPTMQDEQAAQAKAESQARQRAEAEKAEDQKEASLVQDIISKDNDFAICQVGEVEFTQEWQETPDDRLTPTKENWMDNEMEQRVLDSHGLGSAEPSECLEHQVYCENHSDPRSAPLLDLRPWAGH